MISTEYKDASEEELQENRGLSKELFELRVKINWAIRSTPKAGEEKYREIKINGRTKIEEVAIKNE